MIIAIIILIGTAVLVALIALSVIKSWEKNDEKTYKFKVTIVHGPACMIRAYMCDKCREKFEKTNSQQLIDKNLKNE